MAQSKNVRHITIQQFLDGQTAQIKEESLKRWESIPFSSQDLADLKAIEDVSIVAYVQLASPDCVLLLPLLDKFNQVNPAIQCEVFQVTDNLESINEWAEGAFVEQLKKEEVQVPFLIFKNSHREITGVMSGKTKDFKRRLKGLDQEDTCELIKRYNEGRYDRQIVTEFIKLCQNKCYQK